MRFIDQFGAVIFDMCGTFMFGHDRFGPGEDFHATYARLGGRGLSPDEVETVFRRALEFIRVRYTSPEYYEDFPSVRESFAPFAAVSELDALEATFAEHEIGRIPEENQRFLRELSGTHWIGVLSNICADSTRWVPASPDVETFRLFNHCVFSSAGRTIKPSPRIFQEVLAHAPKGRPILFVGDDLNRDMVPAKALGLGTAWIAPSGSHHSDADVVVARLTDLATLEA